MAGKKPMPMPPMKKGAKTPPAKGKNGKPLPPFLQPKKGK